MEEDYLRVEKRNIIYEWKIDEITSLIKTVNSCQSEIVIYSPIFSTGALIEDSWYLKLRLNDQKSYHKKWISVFLVNNKRNQEIRTKLSFYILNNVKEKCFICTCENLFGLHCDWGYSRYVEEKRLLERKDEFLPMNSLTLCIDLTVYDDYESIFSKIDIKNYEQMAQDFKQLFNNKLGSDVILVAGDTKFHVHKAILIARSPVLAGMFTHEMNKNKVNIITINNLDSETVKKMVEFIYTGQVIDLDGDADYLLEAADLYMIQSLKESCEVSLSKSITVENAVRMLNLADCYKAHQLLEYTSEFIAINITSVIETDDYKQIQASCPVLLSLIIKKLAAIYGNCRPTCSADA